MNAEQLKPYIDIRHQIHEKPELSYDVYETAALVKQTLQSLGYQPETEIGKTGVTAILDSGKPGKTVALRADMDALPLQEHNELPYKSKVPGKMHACSHDGHTATLLAAADFLRARVDEFSGKIKFIFQPAEEGGAGARAMIEDGVLTDVDAIFGYHNWLDDKNVIGVNSGTFMASADQFSITLSCIGGHGAHPPSSPDPIYVSAQIIIALQAIRSRYTDPTESVLVTIGKISSGTASNIIPDTATMLGTIRAETQHIRDVAKKYLYHTCEKLAELNGIELKLKFTEGYPPTINHDKEAQLVLNVAHNLFPDNQVKKLTRITTMGAEDFSFYLEKIPGCYFFVGNGSDICTHSSSYNFNDDIMLTATKMMMGVAIEYLNTH